MISSFPPLPLFWLIEYESREMTKYVYVCKPYLNSEF